ncbi:MAG: hydrolase [Acidobacteria bacterium]|nr:hydrolase [Acidobacteriota bacterium]
MTHPAKADSSREAVHTLLTPENCTLIFIDHQPQMLFGVANIERQVLINNVVGLAKAAKTFNIPTILTTVETESFSGFMWPQLLRVFPDQKPIERSSMNSWDDPKFVAEVERIGRKKLVIAALWTEVCLAFPAIDALRAGYEVYAVVDASGGMSKEIHDTAVLRLVQAGVVPVTWVQVMLEWQRDWARKQTYDAVIDIVKEHCGAYGSGVEYAYTMVHKLPPSK